MADISHDREPRIITSQTSCSRYGRCTYARALHYPPYPGIQLRNSDAPLVDRKTRLKGWILWCVACAPVCSLRSRMSTKANRRYDFNMNKQSLIHLLKEGLNTRRITDADYNAALDFYALIYEEKTEDESSDAHAELASLINTASGVMDPQLTSENRECVIEAEIKAAEEFLASHPILSTSPADLEREKKSIADYLSQPRWTPKELELWKEYYDV